MILKNQTNSKVLEPYTVVSRRRDHKPFNVGTMLCVDKTKIPFGRVVGYYFGSVTKPGYVVSLDSGMIFHNGTNATSVKDSPQHIDEEDLYKRFHDPIKNEFDLFDPEVSQLHYQHYKSTQSTEPDQHFHTHYQPMMYHIPETNHHNQMGIVPNLLHSQAPMMYQPEQPFMRPYEGYQHNQDLGPNFRSSLIIEPNLGAQGSTLFSGQSYFNQPFGMQQQLSRAPMMYNQFMRHETNQQNQMGTIPNLVQYQAPMMYNQQQRFGVHLNYSNQQHFGLPEPRTEMKFNPQTQHTMQYVPGV